MNTMTASARVLVSESDFLALPESTRPAELVDGEVIMAPSPNYWHQELLGRLVMALRSWAMTAPGPVTVAQAPLDVRFAAGRILQPDAMVFLGKLDREVAPPVTRIPEVCIEVLSSNRTYDRITKRFLYAEAGVLEYWLIDPGGFLERRSGPGLVRSEELTEELRSPLLPGFVLDLAGMFD
jgi:Uma2 family endonuclease